ncbi:NAD-dependent protein deacylase [Alloprevotella sp. OH1205_COT-284]|uniref:Sir2 family NAD-dependent protein deacetylase n=1 Tax=Alloprevotella sp. OH1205_COT-284 TaxID=2491043 RepID=UPI000F5F5605|nr:Sir2 family NAD-dependent protein deacetylase [Alloprevotella sp. OH1205_COT-284]RRD80803.1 NAD-dependent protein deacylase [Alloprevotella sp. OH1205_COT-284]
MKKKIVVLTGAGVSAESGFSTFRDKDGLWETHPVEQVATPEGWQADPVFVNEFYNGLRRQLVEASPNEAHRLLARLEKTYDVTIITQNVDNLHERGGSSKVIHLHGELMKACSSIAPNDPQHIVTLTPGEIDIRPGQLAGDGSLLRPFIVWFGEPVPLIEAAAAEVAQADIFVIIGSSLAVYPAAGLIRHCRRGIPVFLIDPQEVRLPAHASVEIIREPATIGVARLIELLNNLP